MPATSALSSSTEVSALSESHSPCFLVFSDDWGEHPSSCQHIFKHIAKDYRVLWVNTIGMRTLKLSLYDLKKAILKLKKMFHTSAEGAAKSKGNQENDKLKIEVIQPLMLPFITMPGVRWLNRISVVRSVRKTLLDLGLKSPIMVITAPNACDYIGSCGEGRVVYYCVDDFSEWPGLEKSIVLGMENDLIERSDVFFATSDLLYDRIARHNKPVELLSHGVDVDFFSNLPEKTLPLLEGIPQPRMGYFGLFDDRSDQKLIKEIALAKPDLSIVITGNVETNVAELEALPNVYFTGSVDYSELPALCSGLDILMLAYKLNELTDAIQPLKLKEYLATGRPVISTPIKEAVKLGDYISLASNGSEWQCEIDKALNTPLESFKQQRRALLDGESWKDKASKMLMVCL